MARGISQSAAIIKARATGQNKKIISIKRREGRVVPYHATTRFVPRMIATSHTPAINTEVMLNTFAK